MIKNTSNSYKAPSGLQQTGDPPRELLVLSHDSSLGAEVIAPAFQSRGWDVQIVGPADIDTIPATAWAYDLIILQIDQPGPDGFALCDIVRQHSNAPLLLVVSQAARKDVIQGFQKGADAYVVEPFDLRELLVRAEALLRRAEGRVLRPC